MKPRILWGLSHCMTEVDLTYIMKLNRSLL